MHFTKTYNLKAKSCSSGQLSITLLFFSALSVVLLTGFIFLATSFLNLSVRGLNKAQAFGIAEAGIEYYRWHLAHASTDYQDGTGAAGPYTHIYYSKSSLPIGQFILDITPPPTGSTVVKIRSTGKVFADSSIAKIIEVKLAIPSFAKYAVAANNNMRFGAGTEVFGEILSNGGIRFDALAHNLVSSALSNYDDVDFDDCNSSNSFGVHTCLNPKDPSPPAAVPSRPDVFMTGRTFPVPRVDFDKITHDLSTIKTIASSTGYYFPTTTALGYNLVFATSGIFSVYKITATTTAPGGCTNDAGQTGWATWSIKTQTLYATGTIPANGNMFFEDNLWVKGQVVGKRVTIGSGKFPDNPTKRTSITVNENLKYTNYDGTDALALIAQNNINIGLMASTSLRIDGALIAQNGRIGRYYYSSSCSPYHVRTDITTYGMLGTAQRYGFAYTDGTGYQTRNLVYDSNLLYGPPPNFPLTTDQYSLVSWSEVQ